ncbi:hypothetical protein ACIBF5_06715 [Micromonospora sp. NPDC050417]|uniref:hypothetical protein n=1 Tax=Micromonospora sp. NPDC050417 TaxID=3364280 RepID=UPI003798C20D
MARVWRRRTREYVKAHLLSAALIEIRTLAYLPDTANHPTGHLEQIRLIADACHNLPTTGGVRRDGFDPFVYLWQTTNAYQRAWLVRHLDEAGVDYRYLAQSAPWPPPSTPPALRPTLRWGGWQLPRNPTAFKALDTSTLRSLEREALALDKPTGKNHEWRLSHLHPDANHILRPSRPDENLFRPNGPADLVEYRAIVTMIDGAVIVDHFRLRESSFAALPANLTRTRRYQLASTPRRRRERDTYLWGRDHRASEETCPAC